MISFAEFVKTLREKERDKNKEFERFVRELTERYPRITIVLFGSRAENRSAYLSDYDLLLVTESKTQCSEIIEIPLELAIDLHCYAIDDLSEEIERFNTIVIDAFHTGTCLHDGNNSFKDLRILVEKRIAESRLVRTREGWMPGQGR